MDYKALTSTTRNRPRALLLDLDGTLADTAPDLGSALNRVLINHGRLPLTFAEYRPLVGHGSVALLDAGFGIKRDDPSFDALRDEWLDQYASHICQQTALFPAMDHVLDSIESAAIAWGVATNKPHALTLALMRELALTDRAAVIISGDSVARAKPAPDMLFEAARAIQVNAEHCLYVGDAERDIEAGNAAGMTTLAAAWGYLGHDDDIESWDADGIVYEPADILPYLEI